MFFFGYEEGGFEPFGSATQALMRDSISELPKSRAHKSRRAPLGAVDGVWAQSIPSQNLTHLGNVLFLWREEGGFEPFGSKTCGFVFVSEGHNIVLS